MTSLQFPADLVTFTGEILNGKLDFFYAVILYLIAGHDIEQATVNRFQKQLPGGVLRKRCPENMQQIYNMRKCDFNKAAKQLH